MFNPEFVEHEIAARQAALRREADMERLARQAGAAHTGQSTAAGDGEGLRSRLGDLLLTYGLKLKRLDVPSALSGSTSVPTIPAHPRVALVAAVPLPGSAPAMAQPVSGFSLLRYETLPPVGVFFWRLDRLGAGASAAGRQGYLTLTWLAPGES